MNADPSPTELDPGIRRTVAWLRSHGFVTCDSGDGVSKVAALADGHALPTAHVFMRCDPSAFVAESSRLLALVMLHGLIGHVECSYSPSDGVGLLALWDVDDAALDKAVVAT